MWISVIGVLAVIGAVWIASTKYNITNTIIGLKTVKMQSSDSLENFKKDIQKQLDELKEGFADISASSTEASTTSTGEISN